MSTDIPTKSPALEALDREADGAEAERDAARIKLANAEAALGAVRRARDAVESAENYANLKRCCCPDWCPTHGGGNV